MNNKFDTKLPIVIYGTSSASNKLIDEYNDKVIGILDGYKTEGEFCAKPIITLDSLIGKNVQIIIVASSATTKIIYNRIKNFCCENNINVYNIEGKLNDEILEKDIKFEYSKDNLLKTIADDLKSSNVYFDFGYKHLAPLLVGFILWFIKRVKEQNIKKVVFISRDGYLLKKIYDEIAKKIDLPQSFYIYTSRNFALMCCINSKEDIDYVKSFPFAGTEEEMLKKRFYIDSFNIDIEKAILTKAVNFRENYLSYLNQFNLVNNTAIFDFVSTGTVQMCLEKLLNINFKGVYFEFLKKIDSKKQKLKVDGFINEVLNEYECDNYFLLEPLIKDLTPSLRYINENLELVFCNQKNNSINEIQEIQNGVIRYMQKLVQTDEFGITIDGATEYALYELVNIDKVIPEFNLVNYDIFTNRKIII